MEKHLNYIIIEDFMISDLKLKGNDLLIFAIIFGFSKAPNQKFTSTANYLANRLGVTERTVLTSLQTLTKMNLLIKENIAKSGSFHYCNYRANFEKLNIDFNDIIENKEEKQYEEKHKKTSPEFEQEFEELWSYYPKKKGKASSLKKYIQYRSKIINFMIKLKWDNWIW